MPLPLPGKFGPPNRSIFRSTVIVFAGSDISAAARDVDLFDIRVFLLPAITGHSDEVARNSPFSVVAHGMRGIATQCEHWPFTGPEAEGLEPGINSSLRLFADPRHLAWRWFC